MCGIAGIAATDASFGRDELAERLRPMASSMAHRGPDDEGIAVAGDGAPLVGLCNRRLAVQDCSELGHQPMRSDATGNTIAFNGELYNVAEVRGELAARGISFRGHSDTEVVLRAFDEWGLDCLPRLRGMFAMALWHAERRETILVRDRLGIKPLYYALDGARLVFASELRTLLLSELVPRRLSVEAVASYLALGAVQEPFSMVEGVRVLPPGHFAVLRPDGLELREYWSLERAFSASGTSDSSPEALRALLEEATRLHLVSDVPLGVFLSGGIDSSALVGLVASVADRPPTTVSVVFPGHELSEERFIDVVQRRFETEHVAIPLDEPGIRAQLPGALAAMDQPTDDGINTYVVSGAAREAGLTVVLSGLGGDELFAGYDTFTLVPRLNRIRRTVPAWAARASAAPVALAGRGRDRTEKLVRWLRDRDVDESAYALKRERFGPAARTALLGGAHVPQAWQLPDAPHDEINALSQLEMSSFMRNVLLHDGDVMSMAHSIELRVPLLDHVLVEHVAGIRGEEKLNGGGVPKRLLVEAVSDLLPHEVVHRPKMGFIFPFSDWLHGALHDEVDGVLSDPSAGGQAAELLDAGAVADVWRRFQDGRAHWTRPWSLYVLKSWCERHLAAP